MLPSRLMPGPPGPGVVRVAGVEHGFDDRRRMWTRDSSDDHLVPGGPGGGDTHDEAGGRHDAVVGAEDGGPKPSDAFRAVAFCMAHAPLF